MPILDYMALRRSWAKFPPLHVMAGAYLGYGKK